MTGVDLLNRLIRAAMRRGMDGRHLGWLGLAAFGVWLRRRYEDDAPTRQVITIREGQEYVVTSRKPS